jgi:RHH-type proline utilization regulon transcriptional repressor/proline dehydrogenase/delta 1-pyrroline-5-carboxylate dehydrogenase
VIDNVNAGNVYVNRNIVGAVVGVQPFGGEGLSGTGPKAGGPLYLYRLRRRVLPMRSNNPSPVATPSQHRTFACANHEQTADRPESLGRQQQARRPERPSAFAAQSQSGITCLLAGPTGERNSYAILPREHVLCLAEVEGDLLTQLAAVLAVGGSAVWPEAELTKALFARLPKDIQARIKLVSDWNKDEVVFDAVLHHGHSDQLRGPTSGQACRRHRWRAGSVAR